MVNPMIGQTILFGGNFAPRGWAFCEGQLLAISSNTALFSILGTTYGGDGRTTFGLPDLRGRGPKHFGNSQGPGLSPYRLGEKGGSETETLRTSNIPAHNHPVMLSVADDANTDDPEGAFLGAGTTVYNTSSTGNNVLAGGASTNTGSGLPFQMMQPYIAVNYIIALFGTYPSRN
ncbi:tail fiber protein [Dokdonia sp.]|uniref:phage tail protein n=1 Tax=Dokdonia sp. TaxID=2024995 RepID=UPI0032663350